MLVLDGEFFSNNIGGRWVRVTDADKIKCMAFIIIVLVIGSVTESS